MNDIIKEINRLKKEKNAVIVAHNYQIDEVQDIADLVGDSFALSKFCANSNADVIVFCGVHFMAESAKIISPKKTVILPEKHAGCPMADMVTAEALKKKKVEHPGAAVVCYINSSAEVKAESDICCTSSNAVNVVNSLEQKDIIFVPDENLGSYIAEKLPHKNIILWNGYCITHHKIKKDNVLLAKEKHPEAILLVHPECRKEIVDLANFVGSTKQIINYAATSDAKEFIIGTEMGIMHKLKMESPDKKFYLMSPGLICPNMKKTTLDSILHSLQTMTEKIELDENVRIRARKSLDRMLSVE